MIDDLVLVPFNCKFAIIYVSVTLGSNPGKSGTILLILVRHEHKAVPQIPAVQEPVFLEVLISEGVEFLLGLQQWIPEVSHGHSGVLASKSVGKGWTLTALTGGRIWTLRGQLSVFCTLGDREQYVWNAGSLSGKILK